MKPFQEAYDSRFSKEKTLAFISIFPNIEDFMKNRMGTFNWISGHKTPMAIDIHCFVVLERIILLENSPWHAAFEAMEIKERLPTVYTYVKRFRNYAYFKMNCMQFDTWCDHLTLQGKQKSGV